MLNTLLRFLQGRFINHPLHPIFVHLPIGLWVTSLICDILFMINGEPAFAAVSYYCILFGVIGVVFAAPTGFAEYVEIPPNTEVRRIATTHLSLNLVVSILYVINFFTRHGLENGIPSIVTRGELLLSTFSISILSVSGYLGGILVYEYGVGHKPASRLRAKKPDIRRVA